MEQPKGGGCKRYLLPTRTFDSDNTADYSSLKFASNLSDGGSNRERKLPLKEVVPDSNIKEQKTKLRK